MKFIKKNATHSQLNAMRIWVMFTVLMERFYLWSSYIGCVGFVRVSFFFLSYFPLFSYFELMAHFEYLNFVYFSFSGVMHYKLFSMRIFLNEKKKHTSFSINWEIYSMSTRNNQSYDSVQLFLVICHKQMWIIWFVS